MSALDGIRACPHCGKPTGRLPDGRVVDVPSLYLALDPTGPDLGWRMSGMEVRGRWLTGLPGTLTRWVIAYRPHLCEQMVAGDKRAGGD